MNDVTAIIVAKDSPPHFLETIASIDSFVSEIIIGNIHIDKRLLSALKSNPKIRLVDVEETIPFADMVKEDLKKLARFDYILYLDPDEIFPKSAVDVIEKKIDEFDYFCFPRKNIIFGKWITNSRWWPDYQLRFFKKEAVIWPKIIHPEPQGKGRGFTFYAKPEFAILHYNYDNLDDYFERAHRYAKAEAASYIEKKEKLTLPETVRKSINEFISRFFACEGYKDGVHGFVLAILQMFYYFLVFFYFWEKKKYFKIENKTLSEAALNYFKSGLIQTNHWMIDKQLVGKSQVLKIKIIDKILSFFKF